MNARIASATVASAERDTVTAPARETAPTVNTPTAKITGPVEHRLEALPPHAPSSRSQAALGPDATHLNAPECTQRTSIWARIADMFHRTDHRTIEHAPKRDNRKQPEQPGCPQRPDFIADAAMAREMFRL
ncbi:hypothetical protein ACNQVK_04890 [Mycobacterium sp. 134]|uniref:hypothetical protein n=1 Tax=Mycobacterium sp. 134 TaxID=3400425 RepID=UPI0007FF8F0D|nr:hypothetical protein A5699_04020 [Mycobacterium sp. E802]